VNQSRTVQVRPCNDLSRRSAGTPLGAIGRGLIAGAVGSLAMDVLWYARYRRGGGKQHFLAWEFSSGLSSWDKAPVPGQVGRRLFEGLFQKKLPPQRAELVSNITHWAYGMLNGALYGTAAESLGQPRIWYGLPFGAGVWAVSYAILPAAGLYKPIREYDRETLTKDLSAHLVYGTTTAATHRLLSPLTRLTRHEADLFYR
jgi:Protein of unknown function (DUF1440)